MKEYLAQLILMQKQKMANLPFGFDKTSRHFYLHPKSGYSMQGDILKASIEQKPVLANLLKFTPTTS